MPNDCMNKLVISHSDENMITRIIDGLKNDHFLEEFIPTPKEVVDNNSIGEGGCSSWRSNNWGTKWDIYDHTFELIDLNKLIINFSSAWSPPIQAYEKLESLGFDIKGLYYEPGMCFCGIYNDGNNNIYDTEDISEIPIEIVLHFDIGENYDEENLEDLEDEI